jgi:hypothetical protein
MAYLQDFVRAMLSNYSEKQGDFVPNKKRSLFFPLESWYYICRRTNDILVATVVSRTIVKYKILSSARARTYRFIDRNAQKLVLEDQEHLDAFESVLGSMSLFGYRRKRPKIGEDPKKVGDIKEGDIFNLVAPLNDVACLHPKAILEMSHGVLSISLSFCSYSYESSGPYGTAANCPSRSLANTIVGFRDMSIARQDHESIRPTYIKKNKRFYHNGRKYKVVTIDATYVYCKATTSNQEGEATERFEDFEYVSQAIKANYS